MLLCIYYLSVHSHSQRFCSKLEDKALELPPMPGSTIVSDKSLTTRMKWIKLFQKYIDEKGQYNIAIPAEILQDNIERYRRSKQLRALSPEASSRQSTMMSPGGIAGATANGFWSRLSQSSQHTTQLSAGSLGRLVRDKSLDGMSLADLRDITETLDKTVDAVRHILKQSMDRFKRTPVCFTLHDFGILRTERWIVSSVRSAIQIVDS